MSLIAVLALQWMLVSIAVRRVSEDYIASQLEHDVEALLGSLHVAADGTPVIRQARVGAIYRQPYSGHYFRITVAGETLRSRSLWDGDLAVSALEPGSTARLHRDGPQGQSLLVLARGYRKQGQDVTVAVAEDLSILEADIAVFRWGYAAISLAALVLLLSLHGIAVSRGLRPLDALRRDLQRLETGERTELDTRVPSEVRPLVDELNRVLHVMGEQLRRYREATGNLAHALKTPLSTLQQLTDSSELAERPDLRDRLQKPLTRIRALTDRELKRARLAGAGAAGTYAAVDAVVADIVEALQRIYYERGLSIETDVPSGKRCAVDREDLFELLGNLLDNACKWARSRVRVRVEDRPGLAFNVEDDGPGADEEKLRGAIHRGTRDDEETAGHGLGLAIVRDIVAEYGGDLELGRSPELGGLSVRVTLPPRERQAGPGPARTQPGR